MKKPNVFLKFWGPEDRRENVRIGVDWYRHSPNHKYRAFNVTLVFTAYSLTVDVVDDQEEYLRIFDRYDYPKQFRLIPWRKK